MSVVTQRRVGRAHPRAGGDGQSRMSRAGNGRGLTPAQAGTALVDKALSRALGRIYFTFQICEGDLPCSNRPAWTCSQTISRDAG